MAQIGIGIIITGGTPTPSELDEVGIFQNYELFSVSNIIAGSSIEPTSFDEVAIFQSYEIAEFQNKNLKNKNNKTNVYQAPESVIQNEQVVKEGV